ncbi:MAG: class I SAM-dependent methyltransferase [Planctomycetes bacterium]|nr:class I SAM-dependent methyltransferase [Planctomycetota bacterium]
MPRKLNIGFAFFPYAGHLGRVEYSSVRRWALRTFLEAYHDARLEKIHTEDFARCPTDYARNVAARYALEREIDILVMIDADMEPDTDAAMPRWFPTALSFCVDNWDRGPHIVGAPYSSPPPDCQPLVYESDGPLLRPYTSEDAAELRGIRPVGAIGTGLMMIDTRAFGLIEPPYYSYEWVDAAHTEKLSTEDVVFTRNVRLACERKLGYNPVHSAWDCWAGHIKPVTIGSPREPETVHQVTSPEDLAALSKLVSQWGDVLSRPLVACEIGSWVGHSAVALWQGMRHRGRLHCVDHWFGTPHDRTGKMVAKYGSDRLEKLFAQNTRHIEPPPVVHRTSSLAAALEFRETLDVLFIDADHSYVGCSADIRAWRPHVRKGGLICGHDYGTFPGVTAAVDEAFGVEVQRAGQSLWYAFNE